MVYYESRKRDLKTRPIYECRCGERLKTKAEKSTRLAYTGTQCMRGVMFNPVTGLSKALKKEREKTKKKNGGEKTSF
jgi:hypothetical protein